MQPGTLVALEGDLGAGKTSLAKAAIASLGGVEEDDVTSPTYVLVAEYPGRVSTWHIDAYRLGSAAALRDLGLELERQRQSAVLLEWPERVREALPADHLTLLLEHQAPGREVSFKAGGAESALLLERLLQAWEAAPLDSGGASFEDQAAVFVKEDP